MSIIYKVKDQLMENDFNKKVMDISKIKINGFGGFFTKILSVERINEMIWNEILDFTKNWAVDDKVILKLHENFDKKVMVLRNKPSTVEISNAFRLLSE